MNIYIYRYICVCVYICQTAGPVPGALHTSGVDTIFFITCGHSVSSLPHQRGWLALVASYVTRLTCGNSCLAGRPHAGFVPADSGALRGQIFTSQGPQSESSLLAIYWSESPTSSGCFSRLALRHGSLNFLFRVALYLPSCMRPSS